MDGCVVSMQLLPFVEVLCVPLLVDAAEYPLDVAQLLLLELHPAIEGGEVRLTIKAHPTQPHLLLIQQILQTLAPTLCTLPIQVTVYLIRLQCHCQLVDVPHLTEADQCSLRV